MTLVSIDIDTKCSWAAVFRDGKFDRVEAVKHTSKMACGAQWYRAMLQTFEQPDYVVIEDQYFNEGEHEKANRGGNVLGFKRLVEARAKCESVCEMLSIPCETVLASVWQTAMLHHGRGLYRAKRSERKATSILVAEQRMELKRKTLQLYCIEQGFFKQSTLDHASPEKRNEKLSGPADAINIGYWWMDKESLLGQRRKVEGRGYAR